MKGKRKIMIFVVIVILLVVAGGIFWTRKNQTVAIEHTVATPAFKQIKINEQDDSIIFKTGSRYRVTYTGQEKLKPYIVVKNGILEINSPHKSVVINGSIFNLFGPTHSLLGQVLTIELPKKELQRLDLSTANGKISADYLHVKTGEIESSNGKISIDHLETEKGFYVSLDNGMVQINHNNASGYDLSLDNGHINFTGQNKGSEYEHNSKSKNALTVEMSNGKIEVN